MRKINYRFISLLVLGFLIQYTLIGNVNALMFQPKPPEGEPGTGPPGQSMDPIDILLSALYLVLLIGTLIAILVKKSKKDDRL